MADLAAQNPRARLLRFAIWAGCMLLTSLAVTACDPRKAVYVPCFFLAIMVPMVLLPLKPNPKA